MSRLSEKILQEIEERRLSPRSAAYFLAKRWVFWALAAISIGLGALSVALGLFGALDYLQTGGRGFDEMPFDDLAGGIPALSALFFVLFVLSSYLALARTRRGYRWKPPVVVGLAALMSVIAGLLLYGLKAGPAVHAVLSANIPAYKTYTFIPYDEWRKPAAGRLGGEALSVNGQILRLKDFDGREWSIDISDATISFPESPVEEGDIAIRGEQTGPFSFKARSIDPFD